MPSANTIEELYDIENPMDAGALTLLVNAGVPAYTRLTLPRLSKPVPRVEVQFRLGSATGHKRVMADGTMRNDAWEAQLALQIITRPGVESDVHDSASDEHGALRSLVRSKAEAMFMDLDDLLPYHSVNNIDDSGTTATLKSEDGFDVSTIIYALHVNIRTNAWPETA